MRRRYCYEMPIGRVCIEDTDGKISAVYIKKTENIDSTELVVIEETDRIREAKIQLEEYFRKERTEFDLPLYYEGTAFQRKVWEALQTIPYGQTRSYKEIAVQIGNPAACRAVGGANNKNRVMIVIPCHRVIGANGSLIGYGAGIDEKLFLLELERDGKDIINRR